MIISNITFYNAAFHIYNQDKLVADFNDNFWQTFEGVKYELITITKSKIASFINGELIIPIEIVYDSLDSLDFNVEASQKLSADLMGFLKIPELGKGQLLLESKGAFRSKDFTILKYYRPLIGSVGKLSIKTSPVLHDEEADILLSRYQNQACQQIFDHDSNSSSTQEDSFRLGASLKRLAKLDRNIEIIGGRLAKEDIEDITTLRPKFTPTDNGGIKLGFDLETGDSEEFEELVRDSNEFQEVFTVKGEKNTRKRYILSENSKQAINSFRRKSHFSKDEKRLLIEESEEYLKGFSLDDYSERVVGYGVLYAPKVNAFKGEDGIDWINIDIMPITPDETEPLTDQSLEEQPLKFRKEEAKDIYRLIVEAEEAGHDTIELNGRDIIITDQLKKVIEKQAESPQPIGLITKSNIDDVKHIEGKTDNLCPPQNKLVPVPESFNSDYKLKEYQHHGFSWLHWCIENKLSGALLADDMGMGKTIQICALFAYLKAHDRLKTTLLILPPILIDEWEKEIDKFVTGLTFYRISGKVEDKDVSRLDKYDIVAISYQALLKNQRNLGKINFKTIVCDEVQFIKNPASARTQAVLAMNGEFKIASTATPIENSISELWAILDYSNPGYLPSLREFNKKYGERNVPDNEFRNNIETLRKKLLPIVLRRTKEDHLKVELPKKNEITTTCEIDEKQVLLCQKIITAYQEEGTITNFLHFFQLIVMALTNPELMNCCYDIAFPTNYVSPKMKKTIELVNIIHEKNEKVLIFADRKIVQTKLKEVIERQFSKKVNIINANTNSAFRRQYTDSFKADGTTVRGFDVLILSPRCAGFGLNLVKANHVIHYLRSFNPALENQATDRVYRIGQEKVVTVHKLVATTADENLRFTVEQKLDEMIERKKTLLKDYLYASRAGNIKDEEIAKEMGYKNPGMSLSDVDRLEPLEFESFTAVLYEKMGYKTMLTPLQDFGADCIALGSDKYENTLIQCKKKMIGSKSCVGNSAVQEIVAAKLEYERQYQVDFTKLAVITNGYFTEAAYIQAGSNKVVLINRNKLVKLLEAHVVTRSDFENWQNKE